VWERLSELESERKNKKMEIERKENERDGFGYANILWEAFSVYECVKHSFSVLTVCVFFGKRKLVKFAHKMLVKLTNEKTINGIRNTKRF